MKFVIVTTQFQVSIAMNFQVLTSSMCVSYAVRHELASSLMFQSFIFINIFKYMGLA
jgi:hypothetical protein